MYDKGIVSMIVPCYNGEKYIKRFLDSLLLQTYTNIEFIFVNDGSTDRSEEFVLSYKDRLENIGIKFIYIKKENGGLGSAVHAGLMKVMGEYFCWFNIDDILCSNAIEKMVFFLNNNVKYGLVRPDVYLSDEGNPFVATSLINDNNPDKDKENLFENALHQKNFTFGCSMLRTEWFDRINKTRYMYESRQGQNWQILLPMFYYYKSGYIDEPLYYVVVQKNSTSNVHEYDKKIAQIKEYEKILLETLEAMNIPEGEYYKTQIKINYAHRIFQWAMSNYDYELAKNMSQKIRKIDKMTVTEKKNYFKKVKNVEYWMYLKRQIVERLQIGGK